MKTFCAWMAALIFILAMRWWIHKDAPRLERIKISDDADKRLGSPMQHEILDNVIKKCNVKQLKRKQRKWKRWKFQKVFHLNHLKN